MSDKHFGKTYNLNGPAILSGPKVASIWSKVLGKEIKYAGVSFPSRCPHFSLRMSSYKCGSATLGWLVFQRRSADHTIRVDCVAGDTIAMHAS